jgi:hypothetical protein
VRRRRRHVRRHDSRMSACGFWACVTAL